MSQSKTITLIAVMMFCCGQALAEDEQELLETNAVATEDSSDADEVLSAFDSLTSMSDDELNSHRAKEDIEIDTLTINDQDQDGNVTDNVAVGNTTGHNTITEGSFTNSSGFVSTVQNTGNNVLIQHSTIINVDIDTVP